MKAINGLDVVFSDEDGKIFQVKKKADLKRIHAVVITRRHQKNRQNGQQIRLLVNSDHPEVCPALVVTSMVLRKVRLQRNTKLPLAIFKATHDTVQYLTPSKVTEMRRKAVKIVYTDVSKKDLAMYCYHSIRVWTCICLDEAEIPPDLIKERLP